MAHGHRSRESRTGDAGLTVGSSVRTPHRSRTQQSSVRLRGHHTR
jgi:hypothetical protein